MEAKDKMSKIFKKEKDREDEASLSQVYLIGLLNQLRCYFLLAL